MILSQKILISKQFSIRNTQNFLDDWVVGGEAETISDFTDLKLLPTFDSQ